MEASSRNHLPLHFLRIDQIALVRRMLKENFENGDYDEDGKYLNKEITRLDTYGISRFGEELWWKVVDGEL